MFIFIVGLTILLLLALIICLWNAQKENPQRIFGVYSQPNKWYYLKYYIILAALYLRKVKHLILMGKTSKFYKNNLEKIQPLSTHAKAFDAVTFQGVSNNGFYLSAGMERRQEAKILGSFYLLTPKYDLIRSNKLPRTVLNANPGSVLNLKEYAAEGICFTPIEPMKCWNLDIECICRNGTDMSDVKLQAKWVSNNAWFSNDLNSSTRALARSIAKEIWSEGFFKTLFRLHQTHYEQMGRLVGTLTIDQKIYPLDIPSLRTHTFGHQRNWTLTYRFINHTLFLSNGTKISLNVSSKISTLSQLEIGYIVYPDNYIEAITSCNIELYQFSENAKPPSSLGFIFKVNGFEYEVDIEYKIDAVHYVANKKALVVYERFLSCSVNGIKGRGISEWYYNTALIDKINEVFNNT